jgi:sorting and assembly machinery component 37
MLPVPQRYYVPRRIKETYRPRLEAVGLWLIANEPEDRQDGRKAERPKGETNEEKFKRAFEQAKVCYRLR